MSFWKTLWEGTGINDDKSQKTDEKTYYTHGAQVLASPLNYMEMIKSENSK